MSFCFSVHCRTAPGIVDSEASVVVIVNGIDRVTQQSTGNVKFTYRVSDIHNSMIDDI